MFFTVPRAFLFWLRALMTGLLWLKHLAPTKPIARASGRLTNFRLVTIWIIVLIQRQSNRRTGRHILAKFLDCRVAPLAFRHLALPDNVR